MEKEKITSFKDLRVYQKAFDLSMQIFELTKNFPKEEIYSLTDQIRRSSRSVCGQTAEAFRKRKYPKAFSSSLNGAEGEASETQNWILFAFACKYINQETKSEIFQGYEDVIGMLVNMQKNAENWSFN
jgi:four helix bundle protein